MLVKGDPGFDTCILSYNSARAILATFPISSLDALHVFKVWFQDPREDFIRHHLMMLCKDDLLSPLVGFIV